MKRSFLVLAWVILLASSAAADAALDDGGYVITEPRRKLAQIEATYAEMPPVTYEPPADRWKRLPKTMKRLQEGPSLRIVMLGDSIVNDTARSAWVLLLDRQYPKCKVSMVTSVRGSTGCWWYKQPGKVERYVLDQKPDLVIIGGVSQKGDVDAIREVIRQIRAGSEAEILLMTGAFGKAGVHYEESAPVQLDPKGDDYRAKLKRLADEMDAGFLDMRGAWLAYVRKARADGKKIDWFMRDPIHANGRGEQVLGRILDRFFAPK